MPQSCEKGMSTVFKSECGVAAIVPFTLHFYIFTFLLTMIPTVAATTANIG